MRVDVPVNNGGLVMAEKTLQWRVHTPQLLQEVLSNDQTAALTRPMQILGRLLADVANRAIALDDPELNKLMIRLTLYSIGDPDHPDYDEAKVQELLAT
jgi:hypothetical protein